jgi:hypothetical protein
MIHLSSCFFCSKKVTVTAVTISALAINQSLIIKTPLFCYFLLILKGNMVTAVTLLPFGVNVFSIRCMVLEGIIMGFTGVKP